MYYVNIETPAWKDRDTIEASSHSQAAVKGLSRALREKERAARCHVTTHNIMDGTQVVWLYDGWTLLNQTKHKENMGWH
jgi:hypothetical protein